MITEIEKRRLDAQVGFDSERSQEERNKLGQFATPTRIANEIVKETLSYLEENDVRFLDPGIGTGSFFSALTNVIGDKKLISAFGYDVDSRLVHFANSFWGKAGLKVENQDFTQVTDASLKKVNLIIANPPYVRHHHLASSEKNRLKFLIKKYLNLEISGLTGLYCYFLLLADRFLEENAVSAWLIPSEFLDVNYGVSVKTYLSEKVDLIKIHRFDPNNTQFSDALVSSAVVWFRKKQPSSEKVIFSSGDLLSPNSSYSIEKEILDPKRKWSQFFSQKIEKLEGAIKFSDLFRVQRGIATGANDFFLVNEETIKKFEIPNKFLKPMLPSPKQVKVDSITSDSFGMPSNIPKQFLFSSEMAFSDIQKNHPLVANYIQFGESSGISSKYLCSRRRPWYNQEKREPPLFFCTYMGRSDGLNGSPFRFILNDSQALATNVYLLLYPTTELKKIISEDFSKAIKILSFLNTISADRLKSGGRVYGGGLHKLEPKELGNIPFQLTELGL